MIEKVFTVLVNGKRIEAPRGKSLLSLLIENQIFELKKNMVSEKYRFGICGMGICFECEVYVENLGTRRACLININSDLEIKTGLIHE